VCVLQIRLSTRILNALFAHENTKSWCRYVQERLKKSSWLVRTRVWMPTACAHDFLFLFCLLSIVLDSVFYRLHFFKRKSMGLCRLMYSKRGSCGLGSLETASRTHSFNHRLGWMALLKSHSSDRAQSGGLKAKLDCSRLVLGSARPLGLGATHREQHVG
jgi:hypothetical protein